MVAAKVRETVCGLMGCYAQAKGKLIWCEKSPTNLLHLDILQEVFPDARFICLYRHCMDVAHSTLESNSLGFWSKFVPYVYRDPHNKVAAAVRMWIDDARRLMSLEKQSPSACFRVRYEPLVLAPDEVLKPLFGFLGVDFVAGLAERVFRVEHDEGFDDAKALLSRGIYSHAIAKGIVLPRCSVPEPLLLDMNDALEALGYPPVGPDWDSQTPFDAYGGIAPPLEGSTPPEDDAAAADIQDLFSNCIPAKLQASSPQALGRIDRLVQFVVKGPGGGSWRLDLRKGRRKVSQGMGKAHCTITAAGEDLLAIANGRLNAGQAYYDGRILLAGDEERALSVCLVLFARRA